MITFNNLYDNFDNVLALSNLPNLIKIEDWSEGSYCTIQIYFDGNIQALVTADTQFYINVLGETVTNVMTPSDQNNKRFYIDSDEDNTAENVVMALRNCSRLNALFKIKRLGGNAVELVARHYGNIVNNAPITTNIPTGFCTITVTDGSYYSVYGGSKITVDVFNDHTWDTENYVTTLTKNFYGNDCTFDISPVIGTLCDYGKTSPYRCYVRVMSQNAQWQDEGIVDGYVTKGFQANNSSPFLYLGGARMLLNTNSMPIYTYSNKINYSVLVGTDTARWSLSYRLLTSANELMYQSPIEYDQRGGESSRIVDRYLEIPQGLYNSAYYVDITIGNETTRFNIIKPIKAVDDYERVCWRNEYGGISFFDFTGGRSVTTTLDPTTYEKGDWDFYDTNDFEKKRIYATKTEKTVKLTSHILHKEGLRQFESLRKSEKVWLEDYVGNKTYIIPKTLEYQENSEYNNVYTVIFSYTFSNTYNN